MFWFMLMLLMYRAETNIIKEKQVLLVASEEVGLEVQQKLSICSTRHQQTAN